MNRTADVVVVGSGIVGASIAYHLTQRGLRNVTLVEKNFPASGPTGKSSALLRQHYSIEIYARMAFESLKVYRRFPEVVGGECGFVPCGFAVALGPEDVEGARQTVAMQQKIGIETSMVTVEDLRKLFPDLKTDDLAAGVHEPTTGYADPATATATFVRRAREQGATLRQYTEVRKVLVETGKVRGVETADGVIGAGTVVVAAGPWTPRLVGPLGIDLPIRANRAQVGQLQLPEPNYARPILVDFVQLSYFRPEVGNQLFVGIRNPAGVVYDADPDRYNERIDPEAVQRAAALASHRFTGMERAESRGGYAGIYDLTPDLHFILEQPREVSGLYIAAGFSGHGFKHAPMTGRLVAEWVVDGHPRSLDISPFRLDRFKTGSTLKGLYKRWPF